MLKGIYNAVLAVKISKPNSLNLQKNSFCSCFGFNVIGFLSELKIVTRYCN